MRRAVTPPGTRVAGFDLSLQAAAACAVPHGWKHDLKKTKTRVVGSKLKVDATPLERLQRIESIAFGLVNFCKENKVTHVFVEEYAFAAMLSHAHAIGECGGVVKRELHRCLDIVAVPIVASSARKTLLQHVPSPRGQKKGYVKSYVDRNVRRLGPAVAEWTGDEVDAFVIMNHGIMLLGGTPMSFPGEEA